MGVEFIGVSGDEQVVKGVCLWTKRDYAEW